MKKNFVIFALCLVLVLAAAGAAICNLHEDRNQVTVTAETLEGAPKAAEGLVATQSAHYGGRLLWDLTIPLDRPEKAATAFSTVNALPQPEPILDINFFSIPGGTVPYFSEREDVLANLSPTFEPLRPIFADVIRRAPAGEEYTETLCLSDYLDTFPLCLEFWTVQDPAPYTVSGSIIETFQNYFTFPVPSGAQWTFTVVKSSSGSVEELRFDPGNYRSLGFLSACGADAVYFAFDPGIHPPLSFAQVPGGYGIYRMALSQEDTKEETIFHLDDDSLETVFSLPEEAAVLDLNLSPDGSSLLVTCGQGEDYTLLVLDTGTMEVKQTLSVPAVPPASGNAYAREKDGTYTPYPVYDWDIDASFFGHASLVTENCLLLQGRDNLYLYTLEETGYVYRFTAFHDDALFEINNPAAIAWNGEKLAVATASHYSYTEDVTGLSLWIYDETGQRIYQADYETSLNDIASEDAEYEARKAVGSVQDYTTSSPYIQLVPGRALALTWT